MHHIHINVYKVWSVNLFSNLDIRIYQHVNSLCLHINVYVSIYLFIHTHTHLSARNLCDTCILVYMHVYMWQEYSHAKTIK